MTSDVEEKLVHEIYLARHSPLPNFALPVKNVTCQIFWGENYYCLYSPPPSLPTQHT